VNAHYGSRLDLPFDLHTKSGPLIFNLPPDADKQTIARVGRELKRDLMNALKLYLGQKAETVRQQRPFPAAGPKENSRFRLPGSPIGSHMDPRPFGPVNEQDIFLESGQDMWLRVLPVNDPGKTWPFHELSSRVLLHNRMLLSPFLGGSHHRIQAEDGFGICSLDSSNAPSTSSVAFAFETGEVWSVDTSTLRVSGEQMPFIERDFAFRLDWYAQFLSTLGIKPPYQWIAGLIGVKGRRLEVPPPEGRANFPGTVQPKCMAEIIWETGLYDGIQTPINALLPFFFRKIFEKCGVSRPDYLGI
jgi:hypothetical protein